MILKECRDCRQLRPLEDFPRNKNLVDGRGLYCKQCFSVRYRESYRKRRHAEGRQVGKVVEVRPGHKRCPDCKEIKPFLDFARNRRATNGVATYCKPCHNVRTRDSKIELHGSTRHYHLTRRYGIGAHDVERMIFEQGGLCVICQRELGVKNVHVDHDHCTGAVRGILCFNCNQALGNVRDDVRVLRAAIDYLEGKRWRKNCSGTVDDSRPPSSRPA